MKTFWWDHKPNLGDVLTPLLLEEYGLKPEWAPVASAEFVGIGSVLEFLDGTTATIWGTGRGGPTAPRTDLSRANVLALRGLMTRALTTANTEVFGDPGLLARDLVPKKYGPPWTTLVVPHWRDQDRMRETYPSADFVDVMGDPMVALEQIAAAELVISSSLHGIVLADSYAIPRMWDWFDGVQGEGFKFRDYGTVVGAFEPGEWVQPDPDRIGAIKEELRECLTHLPK